MNKKLVSTFCIITLLLMNFFKDSLPQFLNETFHPVVSIAMIAVGLALIGYLIFGREKVKL